MSNYILSAALELKDRFSSQISTAERATKKFSSAVSAVQKPIRKIGGELKVAGNDLKRFGSAVAEARNKYRNFGRTISEYGGSFLYRNIKRGVIGAGVGITALSGYAIKGAADMEKYRMALETALKKPERADEYMQWANKFADVTPYTNQEVMEATVKLSAYGIDPKKIMTYLGDLASGMGKPLDQAVEAFADSLTGELERLKEFGITKDMIEDFGKNELKLTNFINKKGQITDYNKFIKSLLGLMESRTKDSMKKQAETFYGMWSTISGVAKSGIVTALGMDEKGKVRVNSFYGLVLNQTQRLRGWLDEAREQGVFKEWGNQLDEIAPKFEGVITSSLQTVKKWGEDGTVQLWLKNTKDNLVEVKDAVVEIGGAIRTVGEVLKPVVENFDKISKVGSWIKKYSINPLIGIPGIDLVNNIRNRGKGAGSINELYTRYNPYGNTTIGHSMATDTYNREYGGIKNVVLNSKPSQVYLENAGLSSKPINQYMEKNIFNSSTTKPSIDINLSGMTINTKADVESIVNQVKNEVGTELTLKLVEVYNLQE